MDNDEEKLHALQKKIKFEEDASLLDRIGMMRKTCAWLRLVSDI